MSNPSKIMYFAYGSNMCIRQMNDRCPNNSKIGIGQLSGYRWIISTRGYANVVKSSNDDVWGVIYEISIQDEAKLDVYEGVSRKCYLKENLDILIDRRIKNCLTYVDPITEVGIPSYTYSNTINEGILDSKLPEEYVEKYLRPKITL
jgi:gamma-glutamylcyclotransferase